MDRAAYKSNPAYAQTYVADTAKFMRFQQKTLRGAKRGSLPHLLFKEAVWSDEYKLSRTLAQFENYLSGLATLDTPLTRLEVFGDDHIPRPANDEGAQYRLEGLLTEYNCLRKR